MAKALFGWWSPKRGEDVLGMVDKHLELTKGVVRSLYEMVEAAADCRETECAASYLDLSRMEMEADELRRKMVESLTKSEMFPEERDDLMELVRTVDWIADWSKDAGRILNVIRLDKAPGEMKESALNIAKANLDCVSVLDDCIKQLPKDPKEAISTADKVELIEEDIDELYGQARQHLATLDFSGWNMGSMILLAEFYDALETVSDWCENSADIVRAIAVRIK